MSKIKIYIKSILTTLIIGAILGFIISDYIDYNSLQKPFFAPPSIVFPIVWTILYTLMGGSYGILKSNNLADSQINFIYYLQLVVNVLWPIFFFIFKWRFFAFLWISLLLALIIIMIIKFYKRNKTAALLQFPYLLWTAFATYLNLSIYLLNR